jgi:hypothetical protein
MAFRNNAFSALAVDSDDDESPTVETTVETTVKIPMAAPAPAPMAAPAPTASKKTKRRQWLPLDLGAVSNQARDHRARVQQTRGRRAVTSATIVASGPAPKFVRKFVNGRSVLIQVNKVAPAKVAIDADSFPAVLGTVPVPTRVSGSWATGVQSIREAKNLPDPAIAKRQHELSKTVWLKRQRAARVTASTGYDDYDESDDDEVEMINDDGLEIINEADLVGTLDDYEDVPEDVAVADESVYASVMDGGESPSLRRVLHDDTNNDDWW